MALSGKLWLWTLIKSIKDDAILLYYAWRHPRTPQFIKTILVALAAYVFSPIDVIPDYLPFIGIADDIALIPAVVLLLNNMLPADVRTECERERFKLRKRLPWIMVMFILFMVVWLAIALFGLGKLVNYIQS